MIHYNMLHCSDCRRNKHFLLLLTWNNAILKLMAKNYEDILLFNILVNFFYLLIQTYAASK